ncbi:MAG: hypothetical protein N2749_00505 [Clostridia bacterium]|nr:hypothetical protein [Clostridia bacterium]
MLNTLLLNRLKEIQAEYLQILRKSVVKLNSSDFLLVIDEINIFWFSKRKIIKIILENISTDYNCYVLMAASFLDIHDNEHFPFVCLGNIHLIDDPLCNYTEIARLNPGIISNRKIKEQIDLAIRDNILILEKYNNSIVILPITLLHSDDESTKLACDASLQLISSMFNDKFNSIQDFTARYKSYEDIGNALSESAKKQLIFTDKEDNELSFNNKIERYLKENEDLFPTTNYTESQKFFLMIFQYICQAFIIMLKCAQFNFIPYIRFDVAFSYLMIISSNFTKIEQLKPIVFKSICSYLLYQIFDKEKIKDILFDDFVNNIISYEFDKKVFDDLKEQNINFEQGGANKIIEVLNKHIVNIF